MKTLLTLLILLCLTTSVFAGELKHVIKDSDHFTSYLFEERASCVEDEHLFIRLSEENWNTILGMDKKYKRGAGWSGTLCIKCRLIETACAGNDWFRYEIETPLQKLEVRIKKLEEKDEKNYNGPYFGEPDNFPITSDM